MPHHLQPDDEVVCWWYGQRDMPPTVPWVSPPDPQSATPVYLQVEGALERAIREGQLAGGDALPAERDLAALFGVSRVTVRQALAQLAARGLLSRRHGSGTFVTPLAPVREQGQAQGEAQGSSSAEVPTTTAPRPLGLLSSFTDDARSRGLAPGARVLNFESGRPTAQEAMSLALSPQAAVYRVRRLRTAGGEPLAVEESTLPAALVGHLAAADLTDASLYALLAGRGLQPQRAIRHLRAVNADAAHAAWLELPQGAALLATERVSWTAAGQPIEFARAHYRGDRYDFVMELQGETP